MTHVTSNTHSSISSSINEKQSGKSDSQTETLFDSLFSIVSELDTESVELITSKLSNASSLRQVLPPDSEEITLFSDSIIKNAESFLEKNNSNKNPTDLLEPLIERLNSLLDKKNLDDNNKSTPPLEVNISNETGKDTINPSVLAINSDEGSEISFQKNYRLLRPLLPYESANSNQIWSSDTSSIKNNIYENDKLSYVVKLIEDAIFSRKAAEPISETSAGKKSTISVKPGELSALDEAIEAVSELKNKKKENIALEANIGSKKKELFDLSKDALKNKDFLNTLDSKNTSVNFTSASSQNSRNNMLEINTQASTRQVDLSQQFNSNSANQTHTNIIGADMHSGGDNGQDGNDNQQSSQHLRTSSTLSAIQKLDMADKAWKEALLRRVEMQLKEGGKTIDLSLNPKQLGRMTVSINMVGDDTSIQISTETSAAATLLLESESKLAQMMHDIGLRLNLLQAGLSGKNDKNSTQNENSKKSESNAKVTSDNEAEANKINLNKLDKSILNIVA